jgi:nicotinate phosphoribosyltransferase
MTTAADHPYLDAVYKLQEYAGRPRRKRSTGKATWPGRKQVYRRHAQGKFAGDVVTLEGDVRDGEALIAPVMRNGRRLAQPRLAEARAHCLDQLVRLPAAFPYPVEISPALRSLAAEVDRSLLTARTVVGS